MGYLILKICTYSLFKCQYFLPGCNKPQSSNKRNRSCRLYKANKVIQIHSLHIHCYRKYRKKRLCTSIIFMYKSTETFKTRFYFSCCQKILFMQCFWTISSNRYGFFLPFYLIISELTKNILRQDRLHLICLVDFSLSFLKRSSVLT